MGRPKTTGKSHIHNASTYTSKTVFKSKKDNSQKTQFSFLHSDQQSSSSLASSEGVLTSDHILQSVIQQIFFEFLMLFDSYFNDPLDK